MMSQQDHTEAQPTFLIVAPSYTHTSGGIRRSTASAIISTRPDTAPP